MEKKIRIMKFGLICLLMFSIVIEAQVLHKVNNDISVVGVYTNYTKWDKVTKATVNIAKMPEGTREGDVVVMFVSGSGGGSKYIKPSGTWKLIHNNKYPDIFLAAYYKVHKDSDPKSFVIGEANKIFAALTTLRGVDVNDPIVDFKSDINTSSLKEGAVAPSVNSEKNGALLCGFSMDNPVVFKQGQVEDMKVLFSYGPDLEHIWGNIDDALTGSIESTSGGKTGIRLAKAGSGDGHCNESTLSISFRKSDTVLLNKNVINNPIEKKAVRFNIVNKKMNITVPVTGEYNIELISLNGATIGNIHRGNLTSGTHELSLSEFPVSAGIYLVQVDGVINSVGKIQLR